MTLKWPVNIQALAQPPLPVQEPKHLVNVVIAHIKDLQKCVVELKKHGGFDETAAEIGVAADELEAALATPPAAQPVEESNKISTEELIYMTGVYDGKVLEREEVIAEFVKSGAVSEDGAIVTAIRARGNT
jgi:hypothetical protein